MAVGDNQGNTYITKEGYGQAYILPDSNKALEALPDLINLELKIAQANQKQKQLAAAKKQADKEAFVEKANEAKQDWWWRHDQELEDEFTKVFNFGAELQSKGVNPLDSRDPASQQFRKDLARIETKGKLSKQLQEQYAKDRDVIDKAPAKGIKLVEDKIKENEAFYETHSLDKVLDEGLLPPSLRYEDPSINLEEIFRGAAGGIAKEGEVNFNQYLTMAPNTLTVPEHKDMVNQQIADMPIEQQDALKMEAQNNGVTPQVYYAAKSIESYRSKLSPKEKIDKILKDWTLEEETIGTGYENTAGVSTSKKTTELPWAKAMQGAHGIIAVNPWLVDQWVRDGATYQMTERDPKTKQLKTKETKTVTDAATAAEALASMKIAQAKYVYDAETTRKFYSEATKAGLGDEEIIKKDRDLYEKLIRGKINSWEDLKGYGIDFKKSGAFTAADKRRLQEWAINQAAGQKMSGDEKFTIKAGVPKQIEEPKIGLDGKPVIDPATGNPVMNKVTVWEGTQSFGAFGSGYPGSGEDYIRIPIGYTEEVEGQPVDRGKVITYALGEKGITPEQPLLPSGEIDNLHRGVLIGTKDMKGKGRVMDLLQADAYLIFPDYFPEASMNAPGSNNKSTKPATTTVVGEMD